MKGERARCLSWLLAVAMLLPSTSYAPNPPKCATDITSLIVALSDAAKRITYASDYCEFGWTSGFGVGIDSTAPPHSYLLDLPWDCTFQVAAGVKDLIKASKFMAKAGFVCGNVDTGCAQQVLAVMTSVAAIAQYVSETVFFCKKSTLWCVGSSCDIAVSIVFLAQNVQTGLELCSGIKYVPPAPPGFVPASGAPEPEPGAPEPEPDDTAPMPTGDETTPAPFGDNLQSSFFPGMTIHPAERRLRAAVQASLDTKVVNEARRQREELDGTVKRFRLQVKQALRRAEFSHALQGQALPEALRILEARIENATAQAKAEAASASAERMEERMEKLLAKFKDFEMAAELGARAPVVV